MRCHWLIRSLESCHTMPSLLDRHGCMPASRCWMLTLTTNGVIPVHHANACTVAGPTGHRIGGWGWQVLAHNPLEPGPIGARERLACVDVYKAK